MCNVAQRSLDGGQQIKVQRLTRSLLIIGIAFLLSSCSPLVDADQPRTVPDFEIALPGGAVIGQTFVARHSGLNGIEIWLTPVQTGHGDLRLLLMAQPSDQRVITGAVLPTDSLQGPGFYRFSFPSLRDSHGHYYYVVLQLSGDAEVHVGRAASSAYLDGSSYVNQTPVAAQMAFRLTYARDSIVLDLVRFGLQAAVRLLAAGLLYVVPGWAALIVLRRQRLAVRCIHWAEALGVAAGIGLTIYPLLLLWLNVAHVRAGPLIVYVPVLGGLVVLAWHYRSWRMRNAGLRAAFHRWRHGANALPDSVLLIVLSLASVSWLIVTRGLEMPLWYDSVQHGVIVQRIVESGGLYTSWEPYAPYQTFSQQFGFHANVAAWAWLTGMATPQAVIWGGQIISLMAVLALYPLGYRIGGVWTGLVSVFVAASMLAFPAYYTNWGRYPQMAGQALLCIAGWWAWQLWHSEKGWRWGDLLLGAAFIVSTVLSYYRMAFHLLALVIAVGLVADKPLNRFTEHKRWLAVGLTAVATLILFSSWLLNLSSTPFLSVEAGSGGGGPTSTGIWSQVTSIVIGWHAPLALVILLGTVVAVWGKGGALAFPVVWLWLLAALPIVRQLPVPGVSIIQDFTIQTSLYMPQALIWGALAGFIAEQLRPPLRRWLLLAAAGLLVTVSTAQLPARLQLIDRDYDLSTRPDLRAAAWIRNSLPQDAFFLINGVVYTDGVSALAGDAGAWLPLLTQQDVVIPPQYALLTEQPNIPGYSQTVNNFIRRLVEVSATSPEGHAAICDFPRPITHVYLGQRQGLVNKALPNKTQQPMLLPDQLLQDRAFRLIYHEDHVMIFEFDRSICALK